MNEYIEKVIDIANKYQGTKEGKNNKNIFGYYFDTECPDFFNTKKEYAPYCMIFVLYCFVIAFGADKVYKMFNLPKKSEGASCTYVYNRNKDKIIYKPLPGAVVIFKNSKGINHAGLITKVNSTHFFTMEGNKSDGLTKECKYPLTSSKVHSFIMPVYSILSSAPTPSPVPDPTPSENKEELYKIIAPSGLRIRKSPNTITGKIIDCMPYESIASAVKYNDKWHKVFYYTKPKGKKKIISGYIYSKWIRKV